MVGWFSAALIGTFRSSLFHSVICSLGGPLSHSSPVVVFFYCGHPRFWNFYSTIPVDVVRVKSYINCLFDPTCVVMRVTTNKLYFGFARTETSAVSEHAHNTGHKPLWNEVKFIDRDPHYYTRRVRGNSYKTSP